MAADGAQLAAVGGVPDLDEAVGAGRGEAPAIAAEGQAADRVEPLADGEDLRPGGRIEADGCVISENGRFMNPTWPQP